MPGLVRAVSRPDGPAIRLDDGVAAGSEAPAHCDSIVAKRIASGEAAGSGPMTVDVEIVGRVRHVFVDPRAGAGENGGRFDVAVADGSPVEPGRLLIVLE